MPQANHVELGNKQIVTVYCGAGVCDSTGFNVVDSFDLWPGLTVTLSSCGTQPVGGDGDLVGARWQVFHRELAVNVGCHAGGDAGLYI